MGAFNEHSFKALLEITGLIKNTNGLTVAETGATANQLHLLKLKHKALNSSLY